MNRFTKRVLAAAVVMSFAACSYASSTNVSPQERAKIESVVHDYLIQKPEILVEAMQALQKKQMQEAEKTIKQTQQSANQFANNLFHHSNDPVAGNTNGKVTVVEFFDYQCPHCIDMAPVIDAVIKANPDLRVVFKEFPIRGPMSEFAARAALAANKQGKYVAFSHGLLTLNQPLSQDVVFQVAKNAGVDVDQLKKDMNDQSVKDQLKDNLQLAQELKLFGTPALFIGKTNDADKINYVPGQMSQAQLQEAIDQASK